jgi:hypothetical protein
MRATREAGAHTFAARDPYASPVVGADNVLVVLDATGTTHERSTTVVDAAVHDALPQDRRSSAGDGTVGSTW